MAANVSGASSRAPDAALLVSDAAPASAIVPLISEADTGYMLTCCALVLFMTPGLAFFYGGLVRRKNVLSILMQCFACMCLVTVLWMAVGFSLSFGDPVANGLIGNPSTFLMLNGVSSEKPWPGTKIPMPVFATFQCMFAVISPALILGAYAERIRFKGFCVFSALWLLLCYAPVCHWAWGGGFFHGSCGGPLMAAGEDAIDFAGGTVVHINAGIAALVCVARLGRRRGIEGGAPPPHNLPFAVLGASMLWFGWFGFNAGSELMADGRASSAFLTTHGAAACGGLTWAAVELVRLGKATVLGVISGTVAGLVAITPACGDVDYTGSLILGAGGSLISYPMVSYVKEVLGYDDSLDVWGIHGAAGIWGSIAVGLLSRAKRSDGSPVAGLAQVWVQCKSVCATIVFTGTMSLLILEAVNHTIGMRADAKHEELGLDLAFHAQKAYHNSDEEEEEEEEEERQSTACSESDSADGTPTCSPRGVP